MSDETQPQSAKPVAKSRSVKPLTANAMAAQVSKRVGHNVTAKRVRQWSRDNIGRFGDDRYTPHAYTAAEQRAIMAGFVASSARRTASKSGGK